jgi:hypothetical protein
MGCGNGATSERAYFNADNTQERETVVKFKLVFQLTFEMSTRRLRFSISTAAQCGPQACERISGL